MRPCNNAFDLGLMRRDPTVDNRGAGRRSDVKRESAATYRFQQLESRLIHTSFLEVDLGLLAYDFDDLVIDIALSTGQRRTRVRPSTISPEERARRCEGSPRLQRSEVISSIALLTTEVFDIFVTVLN